MNFLGGGGGGGVGGVENEYFGSLKICRYFGVNSNGSGVIYVILSFFHEVNVQNGDIYFGLLKFHNFIGAGVEGGGWG